MNDTNATAVHSNVAEWTPLSIWLVIICIIALVTNGSILVTFVRNSFLWTPFNVYLINLALSNFINALVQNPLDIVNALYQNWPLGYKACTLYIYATWVIQAGMRNSHVLITIDRIWAVLSPMSYRNHRKIRTSLAVCAFMWMYIHLFALPGIMKDAMFYRPSSGHGPCYLNAGAQLEWALAVQMIIYNLTHLVIIGAYPIIWYRKIQHARKVRAIINLEGTSNSNGTTATAQTTTVQSGPVKPAKKSSHGFKVLSFMTMSVMVFWTPVTVYFTLLMLRPFTNPVFLQASLFLFSMQSALDPIWFMASMKDLRQAYLRMFTC